VERQGATTNCFIHPFIKLHFKAVQLYNPTLIKSRGMVLTVSFLNIFLAYILYAEALPATGTSVIAKDSRAAICVSGEQRGHFHDVVQRSWSKYFVKSRYDIFYSIDLPRPPEGAAMWQVADVWSANLPFVGVDDSSWCMSQAGAYNHVRMFKMAARWPSCLAMISRRAQATGVLYDFAMYLRPDIVWVENVPDVRLLWERHRRDRDVLLFDDHAAIFPYSNVTAFFVGGQLIYEHCASQAEWAEACEKPGAKAKLKGNSVKVPCCPLRLLKPIQNLSTHDCRFVHSDSGSSCLSLPDNRSSSNPPRHYIFEKHGHTN